MSILKKTEDSGALQLHNLGSCPKINQFGKSPKRVNQSMSHVLTYSKARKLQACLTRNVGSQNMPFQRNEIGQNLSLRALAFLVSGVL